MAILQYHCILGLAEIKTLHPRDKIMSKDAGCEGKKSLFDLCECSFMHLTFLPYLEICKRWNNPRQI